MELKANEVTALVFVVEALKEIRRLNEMSSFNSAAIAEQYEQAFEKLREAGIYV